MSVLFVAVQDYKLASACVALGIALSAMIVAFIATQSIATSVDLSGQASFDEITSDFTYRVEVAFNNSLLELEVVAGLFAVFPVNRQFFVGFLDGVPAVSKTAGTVSWAAFVASDAASVAAFEAAIRLEGFAPNYTIYNTSTAADIDPNDASPPHFPVTYSLPGLDLYAELRPRARRSAIQTAVQTHQLAATGLVSPITGYNSTLSRIVIYEPVFDADNMSQIRGVLTQGVVVEPFVVAALSGFDNSTVQLTWRDLAPDTSAGSLIYQWNSEATNIGSLYSVETLTFAQRSWQFEFHNVLGTASTSTVSQDAGILAALCAALLMVIILTVLFVRYRVQVQRQQRASTLLSMVVPEHVTKELVAHVRVGDDGRFRLDSHTLIARAHRQVALCFVDICDFTAIMASMTPNSAVQFLDEFFTLLDTLLDSHEGVAKIKTIGDAYFAVAGLTAADTDDDDSHDAARTSLLMLIEYCFRVQEAVAQHRFAVKERRSLRVLDGRSNSDDAERRRLHAVLDEVFSDDGFLKIRVRIGVHCGDVVAGVVGNKQPQYDVWGTACNMASRVESSAVNGTLQVSEAVRDLLRETGADAKYHFAPRRIALKGIGVVTMFALTRADDGMA